MRTTTLLMNKIVVFTSNHPHFTLPIPWHHGLCCSLSLDISGLLCQKLFSDSESSEVASHCTIAINQDLHDTGLEVTERSCLRSEQKVSDVLLPFLHALLPILSNTPSHLPSPCPALRSVTAVSFSPADVYVLSQPQEPRCSSSLPTEQSL
jgi:hypothetical protein